MVVQAGVQQNEERDLTHISLARRSGAFGAHECCRPAHREDDNASKTARLLSASGLSREYGGINLPPCFKQSENMSTCISTVQHAHIKIFVLHVPH